MLIQTALTQLNYYYGGHDNDDNQQKNYLFIFILIPHPVLFIELQYNGVVQC